MCIRDRAGLLYRKTYDPNNKEILPGAYVRVQERITEQQIINNNIANEVMS